MQRLKDRDRSWAPAWKADIKRYLERKYIWVDDYVPKPFTCEMNDYYNFLIKCQKEDEYQKFLQCYNNEFVTYLEALDNVGYGYCIDYISPCCNRW